MPDNLNGSGRPGLTGPSEIFFDIEPSVEEAPDYVTRAIYVGTAGDLKVKRLGGTQRDVTFKNVPAGTILPIRVVQVYNNGTTASDIVGLA